MRVRLLTVAVLAVSSTVLAAEPPRTCTLEGTVTLLREGKPVPSSEATVVVYVSGVRQTAANKTVPMFQENRQFRPRVLVLHTGDSVRFENRDYFDHSVFSNSGANTFELPRTSKGTTGTRPFNTPGAVRIQCDIHSTMRADVLVLENGYFGEADPSGKWRIQGLPEGKYTLVAWEPNGGKVTRQVSACDGAVALEVKEKTSPELRRKSGDPYTREYDSP
jgi:plastocyanin